jgi:hypothetical protein
MNSFRRAPTSTLIDRALGSGVDVLRIVSIIVLVMVNLISDL